MVRKTHLILSDVIQDTEQHGVEAGRKEKRLEAENIEMDDVARCLASRRPDEAASGREDGMVEGIALDDGWTCWILKVRS